MGLFLKKVGIGTLCLLLVVGLFWRSIAATAIWGLALHQTRDLPSTRVLPSEPIHIASTTTPYAYNQYHSIVIPHIFTDTDVRNKDTTRIVFKEGDSNSSYLVSPIAPLTQTYTTNLQLAAPALAETCAVIATIYDGTPCQHEQDFVQAMLYTSNKFAGIFSSKDRKKIAGTFLLLKSIYLPPTTTEIQPFTGEYISGYIVHGSEQSLVYVFDTTGAGYEILFIKMNHTQIMQVLEAIKPPAERF